MFVEGVHSGSCHWGTRWATNWYAVDLCVAADELPDEGLARFEENLRSSVEAAREAEIRAPMAVERLLSTELGASARGKRAFFCGRFAETVARLGLWRLRSMCRPSGAMCTSCCDNPVVGKHLDRNTRLLAEIYCSLRHVFRYIFIDNKCSSDTSNLYFVVPLVLVSVRLRRTVRDS